MPKTSRILLPTYGSLGDIHPFLAIALELKARGHHPTLATSSLYRTKIEELGIGFHAIAPEMPPTEEWHTAIPRLMDGKKGTRRLFREIFMPSLRQSYADLLPAMQEADLTVAHTIVYAAPLCAQMLQKKYLSVVLAPLAFWSACDPPYIPGVPLIEKLRHNLRAQQMLQRLARKVSLRWVGEVARFRAELGLPPGEHPLFEGSFSPHGTLALFSKELAAAQPDWPANTLQPGTCFYDRKGTLYGDERYTGALAPDIEAFLQQGEAPVVFTLGSAAVFDARNFYTAAVEAMRRLNQRAILLIGNEDNRPINLPQNDGQIAAFEYAPFSELFPRGAAIVHQGGAGTTGQVLRAGVPSLVMPYSHDQPDHAMRLQRLGVGRTLPRSRYDAVNLMRELQELLSNAQYAQKAKEIGARVQQENGTVAAVDAIESRL